MLYVVAGNGTGPVKEITAALKDKRDAATKAKPPMDFWIILEGKDEPTATDEAIYKWLRANEVWFEVYTSTGTTIDGAQETHATEDVNASFLERIQERQADSEDAAVLILQVDPEGETDADEVLMGFVETVIDADVEVFALNGEMAKILLSEEEVEPEPEPEPAPAATKKAAKKAAAPATKAPSKQAAAPAKAVAKKAAAPAADDQDGAPNDPDDEPAEPREPWTAAELAGMNVSELGAAARAQGIDPKGMGKRDLIEAITSALTGVSVVVSRNGADDEDVLVIIVPKSKLAALLS